MTVKRLVKDAVATASAATLVVAANKSGSKGLIAVGITGLVTITAIDIIRLRSLRKTNKKIEEFLQEEA